MWLVPARIHLPTTPPFEDLILQAGGLLDGASTARVDISRRIVNPSSTTPTEQLSENYSISVVGGLAQGEGQNFIMKPYDVVIVRRSPGYVPQEMVNIGGEVLFA